jgi:Amt family ammonium transporter
VVSTVLGGCGGGLSVIFVNRIFISEHWSYLLTMNGLLAGMVAQCSGCNTYQPWAAITIGIIGGMVFLGVHFLMLKMKLDDPLDAVAVHAGGGEQGQKPSIAHVLEDLLD